MLAYALEFFGSRRKILFRVQYNSLRFAALLLFASIYYYFKQEIPNQSVVTLFFIFLTLSWSIWIIHEINYIFVTQRRNWSYKDENKLEYLSDTLNSTAEWWYDLIGVSSYPH